MSRRVRRACLALALGVLALGVLGIVGLRAVFGPPYPETKTRVFERLRVAGVQAVVSEARALQADLPGGGERRLQHAEQMPPAIRALDPIYVQVTARAARIKITGMGDWAGFVVFAPGRAAEQNALTHRVAEGLYWVDSHNAPESMRGLPEGWTPK